MVAASLEGSGAVAGEGEAEAEGDGAGVLYVDVVGGGLELAEVVKGLWLGVDLPSE